MKKIFLLLFIVAISCVLLADYIPVEIESKAEDSVGKMLVSKFRDIIRRSASYDVTYSSDDPHFKIIISTMDRWKGDSSQAGISTIYNYIILLVGDGLNYYCYSQLGYAGANTLDQVAYEIYSDMDDFIEVIRSLAPYYKND